MKNSGFCDEDLRFPGIARAVAFEWGKGQWQQTAQALGVPPPDIIVAADCVYQDQVIIGQRINVFDVVALLLFVSL